MARYKPDLPGNAASRAGEAADENTSLDLPDAFPNFVPGETAPDVAEGPADFPDTGIPDDLPILPVDQIAEHASVHATDALEDLNDLFLDFF